MRDRGSVTAGTAVLAAVITAMGTMGAAFVGVLPGLGIFDQGDGKGMVPGLVQIVEGPTVTAEPTASTTTTDPIEVFPFTRGDDPDLDVLWDACEAGDGVACDDLFIASPAGSEYEAFGDTCGFRREPGTACSGEDL